METRISYQWSRYAVKGALLEMLGDDISYAVKKRESMAGKLVRASVRGEGDETCINNWIAETWSTFYFLLSRHDARGR
jgi:hypothetical protein